MGDWGGALRRDLPLLRAVPALEERNRNKDDDGLPAVTNLNL